MSIGTASRYRTICPGRTSSAIALIPLRGWNTVSFIPVRALVDYGYDIDLTWALTDASLNWEATIPWLRQHTNLQIWLKGGMHAISVRSIPLSSMHYLIVKNSKPPRRHRTRNKAQRRRDPHLQPRRAPTRRNAGHNRRPARMRTSREGSYPSCD